MILSSFFVFVVMNLYSQVKYRDFLFNLDSLIKPKVFSFVNNKDNSKVYLLHKAVKTEKGYYLILKRYTDTFDIDSTIQFIDNEMRGSIHKENFWFYYIDDTRHSCTSKELNVSRIDYNTPNNHYSKEILNSCDNSIPQIYTDKAIYKGLKTIEILGKKTECIRYKVKTVSIDRFGKTSKRKGYTYLGKNIGIVMFTNNGFFDHSTWKLTEIINYK